MSNEIEYLSRLAARGKLSRRAFLGRAAALGLAAPFANSLLASAGHAAGARQGGTLRAGLAGGESADSLDPALDTNRVPYIFGRLWGEFLVVQKPDTSLEYLVAEEINPSADLKTWTLKIRKGIEFHNGKTLTAQDVAATIERHHDKGSKSGAYGILTGIDTIKASGDEVILTLHLPNVDLPYLLGDYHLLIQPNGGKDDPAAGISAGPYKVAANQPGVRYVGKRFENYWRAGALGHADEVDLIVLNDTTARMSALQGGRVDMINQVEPKIVSFVKQMSGVSIQTAAGKGFYPFNMFCDRSPFDSNDLRMALKLALDRKQMLEKILRGYGAVGNDFPINSAYALFPEGIAQREFDPDKARFHYKKSGHEGSIVLRTSDVAFPGAVDAAQLFQQSCAKAGIKIDVMRVPSDGYWSSVWNKEPFCESYWGGRATQDQMYTTALLSTAAWNDTHFHRPDFDKMLIAARGERDEAKRKDLYRKMALMVRDEGGEIVPFFNDTIDAIGKRVAGFKSSPIGELMNGYALAACWVAEA